MDSELVLLTAILLSTFLSVFWPGHILGEVAGWALLGLVLMLLLTGCSTFAKPQKPGRSTVSSSRTNLTTTLTQPENPALPSSQTTERISRTWEPAPVPPAPTPSVARISSFGAPTVQPAPEPPPPSPARALLSETVERTSTTIGAAQTHQTRSIATKLASMRPVQYVGLLLLLAALSMFHPVVRAVTLSTTLQAVTGATGLALIFVPILIVGHEILLLAAGIGLPALWFIVHRHGRLQGFVDANKDGIDDRTQAPTPTTR